MKAIIIAAGDGSRLGNLTKDLPKSLVDVNGKSIIERQISTFKKNGIDEIIVIIGPNKDKFQLNDVEYIFDKNFHEHEQLGSLMAAGKHFQNDIVISFGDVIVDNKIMKQIVESTYDIGVAIDLKWKKNYENRTQHPKSEADLALIKSNKLTKIKKNLDYVENYQLGEFLGIVKLSDDGCKLLLKRYNEIRNDDNGRFHDAESSTKAYLTDMIQELIDSKIEVKPIFISGKWCEIDTIEDLKSAEDMF
jgi:choline kinase